MKQRLVTTEHGQYVPAPYGGSNVSGIMPLEDKVTVLPDEAQEKIGSIFISPDQQSRTGLGAVTGTVYAVGRDVEQLKAGDRVVFNRYAGQVIRGLDGKDYRIMSLSNIGGLLEIEVDHGE